MVHRIGRHRGRKDVAGKLSRHLHEQMGNLWVLMVEDGVDPTNNRAERALRFAVLWPRRTERSFK
uniref:Transposase IS66 family protein n=1 Tax=Desulfacinum infernum TaxID=35837 RepID=A0A831ZU00_9BACT